MAISGSGKASAPASPRPCLGASRQIFAAGPMSLEAFVDIERPRGTWVRVHVKLGEPDPEVGLHRPTIQNLRAVDDAGKPVALTTEEVGRLGERFEEAYYRWRRPQWSSPGKTATF